MIPAASAILLAVSLLSPVIITTFIPASLTNSIASLIPSRNSSFIKTIDKKVKFFKVLISFLSEVARTKSLIPLLVKTFISLSILSLLKRILLPLSL